MKKYILTIITSALFLTSCETVVDMEMPPHVPKIVLNAYFHPDSVWYVNLSNSVHILEKNTPQPIKNAKVSIFENGAHIEDLVYDDFGYYTGNTTPVAGKTYEIRAEAPGYKAVVARDVIPQQVKLISATLRDSAYVDEWGDYYAEISFRFNDPAHIKNYYLLTISSERMYIHWNWPQPNDTIYQRSKIYYTIQDPSFDDKWGDALTFNDSYFNGREHEMKIYVYSWELMYSLDQEIYITLHSCSESYYRYNKTLQQFFYFKDDPFAEPVQVYNNVENGYGIFGGVNTSELLIRY